MFTRELTKPDGRPLSLYSRRPIAPSFEAPSPLHDRFAPNAHLRWHPRRGEWVVYATQRGSWEDYAQGVTAAARSRGLTFTGFDARFLSTVPLGAGLSSSASFEVALVRALGRRVQPAARRH